MRLSGRNISKWWLLVGPLLLLAAPFGLLFLLVLGHIGGAMVGPTGFLSRLWHNPPREELVGKYEDTPNYTSSGAHGSCASSSYALLEVTGHFKPYDLYWTIGDPD